jgi:ribosomal protein S14
MGVNMGKKFMKLEGEIHREYHNRPIHGKLAQEIERRKGREAAEKYVAEATAAKVYREQQHANHRCQKCGTHHSEGNVFHSCRNCGNPCWR